MQFSRAAVVVVFCVIFYAGTTSLPYGLEALAQNTRPQENKKVAQKAETEKKTPAPNLQIKRLKPAYEPQLQRLSEVLGSLHYLRTLCGANEGQKWRIEMQQLIVEEQPSGDRKEQLTARFNRGFRSYREIYRECTPAASQAAAEYLREGIKLSSEIPNRYGN